MEDKPGAYRLMRERVFSQLSPREVSEGIRHFWAYCTYLDELFGRLPGTLEGGGQAGNTLVLYCSDHGDYCGDHGLFAKGIPCFRGAYHVPAIIRWPEGVRTPGRSVDDPVSLADFAPTILDAAGVKADARSAEQASCLSHAGRSLPHGGMTCTRSATAWSWTTRSGPFPRAGGSTCSAGSTATSCTTWPRTGRRCGTWRATLATRNARGKCAAACGGSPCGDHLSENLIRGQPLFGSQVCELSLTG